MRPFILDAAADAADALRLATAGAAADAGVPPLVQYLAGGTNLLDLMKLDVMQPARIVSISKLQRQFGNIAADASGLRLGALVRMAEAADHPVIRRDYPVLAQSLWKAASPQLRNMATLGGNVLQRTRCNYFRDRTWAACNKRNPGSGCAAIEGVNRRLAVLGISEHCIANYPGDFANALAALGAEIVLESPAGGTRTIPFEDLHRLPGDKPDIETILQSGELITEFRVPAGPWTRRSLYLKIRDRESYDFALASAAVALDLAADGTVRTARIGLGGLVAKPWRSHAAEAALTGRPVDETTATEAAEAAFSGAIVRDGTAFKPELGRRTLVRALLEAARLEL
jgi:xanthine dehydrogenase YagS FAD-binding subunit